MLRSRVLTAIVRTEAAPGCVSPAERRSSGRRELFSISHLLDVGQPSPDNLEAHHHCDSVAVAPAVALLPNLQLARAQTDKKKGMHGGLVQCSNM